MKLLAIVGSPRKNKATDILVDKAIEGCLKANSSTTIKKIYLAEQKISYCKDCLTCWKNKSDTPFAQCVIRDDMDEINQHIVDSDALIMGTPVHMGFASAYMMTFLERICWTFAKPDKSYIIVKGCPAPRSEKKRKAVIIAVSGMIPPRYKKLCNWATPQIKVTIHDSLNAKTIGELYAGDVWHKEVESYHNKAFNLGKKLAQSSL